MRDRLLMPILGKSRRRRHLRQLVHPFPPSTIRATGSRPYERRAVPVRVSLSQRSRPSYAANAVAVRGRLLFARYGNAEGDNAVFSTKAVCSFFPYMKKT